LNSLHQVAKATGVVLVATTCVVALATVLVVALEYLLLIFLGVLLSVFLTKTSALASRYLPIGYGWNLALITSLLIFSAIGGVAFFGSKVYEKLQSTSQKLDEGTDELVKRIKGYPLAMKAIESTPFRTIHDDGHHGGGHCRSLVRAWCSHGNYRWRNYWAAHVCSEHRWHHRIVPCNSRSDSTGG